YRYIHAAVVVTLVSLVFLGIDRLRLARLRRNLAPSVRAQVEASERERPADSSAAVRQEDWTERAFSALGVLLLLGTGAFVLQVLGVVRQVASLPDPVVHTDARGDLVADIESVPTQDFPVSKGAFRLQQLWVLIAGGIAARRRKEA